MHDYAVLARFDLLKLKNYVLEIRRNPKKLISYFLFVAWILMIILPNLAQRGRQTFRLTGFTADIIVSLYTVLIAVALGVSFFSALHKLSYSFQMGDVNILFPSPLEPRRILFWSLLKKIPMTLARTVLPVLVLTPTFFNMGFSLGKVALIYLSMLSLALLISPVSFLLFLLSVRYRKQTWCRAMLLLAVGWLLANWAVFIHGDVFSLQIFSGYRAPGVMWFPILGWIVQLASSAFTGITAATYIAVALVIATIFIVYILLFRLARDYYEDVLDYTEKIEAIRSAKRSGKMQGIFAQKQLRDTRTSLWSRPGRKKQVVVKTDFPGAWAFMYNQVVDYRRSGLNEYVGYLTGLFLLVGIVAGVLTPKDGGGVNLGFLYVVNGAISYFLFFRTFAGSLTSELALPYIYTLPGDFRKKVLAIHALPTMRFALNILLLNLSYVFVAAFVAKASGMWLSALLLSLIVISVYFEQANCIALGHVVLPSSLDRRLFYPLLMFLEILIIVVPAGAVGGIAGLLTQNAQIAEIAVVVTNILMGILLLALSEKIFAYLEMREFED